MNICYHCVYAFSTDQDPNYYDDLTVNPKSLVAVVVGLTYSSEDIDIKVRKCADGLHFYLKPPKTRHAAYCYCE